MTQTVTQGYQGSEDLGRVTCAYDRNSLSKYTRRREIQNTGMHDLGLKVIKREGLWKDYGQV